MSDLDDWIRIHRRTCPECQHHRRRRRSYSIVDLWYGILVILDPSYAKGVPEADRRIGSMLTWACVALALVILAALIVLIVF